jgi:protein phosphatase
MKSIVFTHKGNRDVNQDFVLVQNINPETFLMLIADGMGGYENGDVAAKIVADNILTYLSSISQIDELSIQKAINKANLAIKQLKEKSNTKLGSTIGGIIINSDKAICFWVGDVKIFHFQANKLQFESSPHTLMNEVINSGAITDAEKTSKYKHVVTRSVQGEVEYSKVDVHIINSITEKDMFLLCSDGVHGVFEGIQIQQFLNTSDTIDEAIGRIENRLKKEAKDNFSLISVRTS